MEYESGSAGEGVIIFKYRKRCCTEERLYLAYVVQICVSVERKWALGSGRQNSTTINCVSLACVCCRGIREFEK